MAEPFTLQTLTLTREKVYFALVLVFSILVWLLAAMTIVIPMILVLVALFTWLASGLLVAQLKADAVRIDAHQFPSLADSLTRVCASLQVREVPELYVLQAGGLLNAFTIRHCSRKFIVVLSDMLEALGPDTAEMRYLLGHEVGHIARRHILKRIALLPGLLLPLLGNAYLRACESSCDRFGAFAARDNMDAAVRAMMVISGGKEAGKAMNPEAFAAQHARLRGFFVSWYELVSGYPPLSQRISDLLDIKAGRRSVRPSRNPLAYFFAIFSLGGAPSGGGNLMVTVAIIGLLAAIAIPNFIRARETTMENACLNNLRMIGAAKNEVARDLGLRDGEPVPVEKVIDLLPEEQPIRCLGGGEYSVNNVGEETACSVHGTMAQAGERRDRARGGSDASE